MSKKPIRTIQEMLTDGDMVRAKDVKPGERVLYRQEWVTVLSYSLDTNKITLEGYTPIRLLPNTIVHVQKGD